MVEKPQNIEVIAYSGYKGEESPRAFCLEEQWINVIKIFGQWIEETANSRERFRCYRLKGSDWKNRVICYDEGKKEWLLRIRA